MNTLTNQDSQIFQQETKMPKSIYHQNWSKNLIRQIYCLLNSDIDPQVKIAQVLAIIGETYQVDNVVLLKIQSSVSQIYGTWGSNDRSWLESFIDQQWFTLASSSKEHQVYQFCQENVIVNDYRKVSYCEEIRSNEDLHCCILSLPLYVSHNFFGYLILQNDQSDRIFNCEEIDSLETIIDQIAIAIQQIKYQERIKKIELENKQLKSSKNNKSDYFSHVSHELRTPLAGILGLSKMLKQELYGPLNEKQKEYVNGIRVSGEHLLALVNDFLDLSKIEADKEELFLENVTVEDICLATISIIQPKADEQNIDIILKVSEQVDFCTVDQRKIKQILINLMSNAIKFTEEASVTLQVEKVDNWLKFCVIDTGIGIKEEDQKKLFQPFQQIHSKLSRQHKGTGLGLALSRKLAQLHEGELTLTSEYGKGSCFTLELPLKLSQPNPNPIC
ncbi:HAMP domain-containing sensor histidine kinase [Crocosphaera sp.]|uniref:sensor histidine kinase n=1 Tax=Crocosphaera sp. TaxID=2729996 RepID=UPI00257A0B33|nr:HAMP domain-containing sensor histidine kinase [Crocosphaera sp.]NQZ64188.1 HAMP domain-containing histidine kinase [Crocosphaera sp.]